MGTENWLVEEEVTPGPDLDVRAVYIRLLEQVIETLKEPQFPATDKISAELSAPHYNIPTVMFAFLDTEVDLAVEGNAMMQIYCFSDRREFLKDLVSYGDEDYLKQFGLQNFLNARESESPTTADTAL